MKRLLSILALAVIIVTSPQISLAQTTPATISAPAPKPAPAPITLDTDKDGLSDAWETLLGTNPTIADTDGDGFPDGTEVNTGYSPLMASKDKVAKRIVVSLKDQKLSYYFGSTKLDEFPISSGLPRTPSPKGGYTVLAKKPVVRYLGAGYDYPNTKWNLMFKPGKTGNYYIHGAYWHNKFGTPRSHGCINVAYANVEKLYTWAEVGTPIMIE